MKIKSLLVAFLLFLAITSTVAQTITSNASGAWTTPATWVGGVVPSSVNDVVIQAAHAITYNTTTTVASLTMTGTSTLTLGGGTLNVTNNLNLNGVLNQLLGGGQPMNIGGSFNVPAGAIGVLGGVSLTITGTTNISGYFTFALSGTGTKTFNNTITVFPGGTWDNIIAESPFINCSIVNRGSWPAPTGATGGVYTISTPGNYTFTGPKVTNMTQLKLNNSGITVTNFGFLSLTATSGNALDVSGTGRKFINGDGTGGGVLYIAGAGIINSTLSTSIDFTRPFNTVEYNSTGNQSVYGTTYYNLVTSNSGTKLLTGDVTVTHEITTSNSSILDATTFVLNGAANLTMTGTSGISFGRTGTTLPELTGTVNTFAPGTSVTFSGAGPQAAKGSTASNPSSTNLYPYQNININGTDPVNSVVNMSQVSLIQNNLTFTNSARMTANPVMTIGGTLSYNISGVTQLISNNITMGNFSITAGTLNYVNKTLTINGNNGGWANLGGGSFINGGSNVIFTTGTNQQISGTTSTSFANLTINNSNNVTLVSVDVSVATGLILTTGRIITGGNNVYVAGGTVTRGTGYVDGNLQKNVATGSSVLPFEIGSGTTYAPVTISFNGVSAGGIITASTTGSDHPGIASSNIEPTKTANRYWSFKNDNTVFTSFDAVFNFDAADLDATANPLNFQVKSTSNSGVTWSTTAIGTRTSTSVQITGEPAATLPIDLTQVDFQAGELIITTGLLNRLTGALLWNNKTTWIENRTGTISFDGTTSVTGSGTLFLTELADGDVLMFQTSAGIVQGTVAAGGRTSNITLTLTANSTGIGSGGYGRQRVPNLVTDQVTIGNPLIADLATTVSYNMASATTINTLFINTPTSPRTTAQILTHAVANLLTVQANAIISQPGGNVTDSWNINAGTASVPGTVTIGSLVNNNNSIANINITTGTLSMGNVLFNTAGNAGNEVTAAINLTGAGTVNMSGSLNYANDRGTLAGGPSGNFNFNGTAAQLLVLPSASLTTFVFRNLIFNNSSTSGVLVSPPGRDITSTNLLGNLRIQSGILVTSDNTDITGTTTNAFLIDPGATFRMTGTNSTFPTAFTFAATALGTVAPFGTVKYEQTSATTIAPRAFGNLQVLRKAVTYTLPATGTSVAGNLTVGDGTALAAFPTILQGTGTTTFAVTGNVTINTNSKFDANSNGRVLSLTVGGNWTNNGTFNPSTMLTPTADTGVTFNGNGPSTPQVISGTAVENFVRVVVNSAATKFVQLNKNVTVANRITLTQGGVDLNGFKLSVNNTATTSITRTSGFVKSEKTTATYGELSWMIGNGTGTFVYPFGVSSTQYIPVSFAITLAGNAAAELSIGTYPTPPNNTPFPVTVLNLNGTSGGNSVVDRFWILTPANATTRPVGTLTLTALATEKPATIASLAAVSTNPAGITGQSWSSSNYWNAPTVGQTFANNGAAGTFATSIPLQVIPNNITPYALTDAAIPLPIKLADFTAASRVGFVELNWKTETEVENDFFTVEKSDGIEGFGEVVKVKGAGTSTIPKSYSAFDNQASSGKWYYRLKQTDFNGNFTYSKIVVVDVVPGLRGVYPNPSSGSEFNFKFYQNDLGKDVLIKVQDISGKELSQFIVEDLQTNEVKLEFSQKLSSGIYIVSIITGQEVVRQKVVVK